MKSTEQQSPFETEISRVEKQLEKISGALLLMKQKLHDGDLSGALDEGLLRGDCLFSVASMDALWFNSLSFYDLFLYIDRARGP